MNSWSFDSVGKGLVSDESVSTRGKVGSVGWDIKTPFIFGSNPDEIQGFGEMGFPPMMRSSFLGPVMAAPHNAYAEENESSSMLSSSIVESSCRESGLFDLKLGRFVDHRDTHGFNSSRMATNLSSSEVFMPSKRTRMGGFGPPAPLCQVHGCNTNLSSCKDYHKRHKVCEVHSKTAKVIVNGIEQRFCQQCSRFHLLGEFDDGKRSCRRRLADHNERRRKPHAGVNSRQHGKSLPPYKDPTGSKFKGSTNASYLCHEIPPNPTPNAQPHHQKYDTNQWWHRKFEDPEANDLSTALLGTCNQHIGASNSVSWPIFHSSPMGGSEDLIFVDSASTVQGLSGLASDSWSALSLLSSHSQGASCHSPRNPISSFGFSGGSNCVNPTIVTSSRDQVCSDDGSTINLLQLSSQLERVEHQKQTYANDVSVGFMATEKTGF